MSKDIDEHIGDADGGDMKIDPWGRPYKNWRYHRQGPLEKSLDASALGFAMLGIAALVVIAAAVVTVVVIIVGVIK